jgi:FKBP-type peptidyl-prolyl cis-trans isomerase SlyD
LKKDKGEHEMRQSLTMNITIPCVVELTWTLKDTLGSTLDELHEGVEFFVGGRDLLAKIEHALLGQSVGATLDLHLEPEDAFGDYNEQLVFLESRSLFPAEIEEGQCLEGSALPSNGSAQAPQENLYTITDIYPDHVVLDGNHPLSGIALRLHLKVHRVREATAAELEAASMGVGFFYSPELAVSPSRAKSLDAFEPMSDSDIAPLDLAQINPALAKLDEIFDFDDDDDEDAAPEDPKGTSTGEPNSNTHKKRLH